MLKNILNAITRLTMDRLGRNLGGRISSYSRHAYSPIMRLPWQQPLPSNGSLNIQQLWASGGRTPERILMKFGTQQQLIRTTMTVTWSNIKIFKFQNGGDSRHVRPNIRNVITRLPIDRLGRNLGGRVPSCSRYWKCYNFSYDGTDLDESRVVARSQPTPLLVRPLSRRLSRRYSRPSWP